MVMVAEGVEWGVEAVRWFGWAMTRDSRRQTGHRTVEGEGTVGVRLGSLEGSAKGGQRMRLRRGL